MDVIITITGGGFVRLSSLSFNMIMLRTHPYVAANCAHEQNQAALDGDKVVNLKRGGKVVAPRLGDAP